MNIQGKIIVKMDPVQVSDKFTKREFVVEHAENPMYPQSVLFQLTQDKCQLLDAFNEGDMIDVSFNIRGRSWTSPQGEVRYFNSLEAWRLVAMPNQASTPAPEPVAVVQITGDDDLPF